MKNATGEKTGNISGCGSVWLECLIWDQEAAGSNPVTPIFLYPFLKAGWYNLKKRKWVFLMEQKIKKDFTNDYTEGKIFVPLLKFSTPLMLANLLQIVYNMVDMIIVGNVNGQVGISAVSIGGSVTDFFTCMTMGLSNAAQIIISQLLGAKRRERIGAFVGTFTIALATIAITFTALSLILRRQLLVVMNTPEEAFAEALSYSVISMSGIIFVYGYNAVSAIMRGLGDAKRPFIFIAIAAVTNIILDILFVMGFKMGAAGAALATIIGQALSFVIALIYLTKNKDRLGFELHLSDFRVDRELLVTFIKLGIPMALKNAAVTFSRLFVSSFVNSYGVVVSAVSGIGYKLNSIANLVSNSMNTAGASMVGQNIGAEKYDRIPKIMKAVWITNLSLMTVLAAIVLIFPRWVFGLFGLEETAMNVAMEYVPVILILFYATALRSGANALINGSGNFAVNMAVALLDALILRLGLGLLLGLVCGWEYRGFWYGDAFSAITPFVIGIVFLISGRWKTRKHIVKD